MDAAEIKKLIAEAGAYSCGIAKAGAVGQQATDGYRRWLADGMHGGMAYLEKYDELRSDPRLLLPGARSVISCAFNYHHSQADRPGGELQWAEYALGDDYHDVVRARLNEVASKIREATGAECRVCVDTAPVRERHWAVKAGLGFIGLNNQLIIPGAGSRFFIGEILTSLELDCDEENSMSCLGCGRCLRACPGQALVADGTGLVRLDARKCLSYLTIEYRGEPAEDMNIGKHVYGCDVCQSVCPHNDGSPLSSIAEFAPRQAIAGLTAEQILEMTQEEFSATFRKSAIKRTKLAGLQRNARMIKDQQEKRGNQSHADGAKGE